MNFERKYGNKYNETKNLGTTEIAKLIRSDIKNLVQAGTLPKGKYSVTSQYYSGGSSITIQIKSIADAKLLTDDYAASRRAGTWSGGIQFSKIASDALEVLKGLHNAYNYDGSDSQYDHFDTRFYGNAEIDCQAINVEAPWGVDKI